MEESQLKIELPFDGFYESIHDSNIDNEIEQHFQYDFEAGDDREMTEAEADAVFMADVDWKAIQCEYAEAYADAFGSEFELESLKYDDMTSPKFYNFSTDRIFCTVDADEFNSKIRKAVESDPAWKEYIRERFTSYDGFWSNYSNNIEDDDWTAEILDECQYGTMLHFYVDKIWPADDALMYLTEDFEMCNWDSINTAIDAIEQCLKDNATEEAKQ